MIRGDDMEEPKQHLLDLSPELLSNVLSFLGPSDIVCFGKTCRSAYSFIFPSNSPLWRGAFLQVFDDPDGAQFAYQSSAVPSQETWDWHAELKRRLAALQAVKMHWRPVEEDPAQAQAHIDALLSIVDTCKLEPSRLDSISSNLQLLTERRVLDIGMDHLIHESRTDSVSDDMLPGRRVTRSMMSALEDARRPETACRLHVLYGMTNREQFDRIARGQARRKVYNWSFTSNVNDYGPFKLDGSGKVNWHLLESVCMIISRVFEMCVQGQGKIPQGFEYAIPYRTLPDPTEPDDWARVTGVWFGTYAFIDYADLFAFNTDDYIAMRALFDNDNAEAHGDLMCLDLKLDMPVRDDPKLRSKIPVSSDLPVLYFSGTSGSVNWIVRPMARVRGMVALLPGGREVRWKWIVNYSDADMWQLEGVQPGGVRSGGVYGLWSSAGHEENGPVGPFCYFPRELCQQ